MAFLYLDIDFYTDVCWWKCRINWCRINRCRSNCTLWSRESFSSTSPEGTTGQPPLLSFNGDVILLLYLLGLGRFFTRNGKEE